VDALTNSAVDSGKFRVFIVWPLTLFHPVGGKADFSVPLVAVWDNLHTPRVSGFFGEPAGV